MWVARYSPSSTRSGGGRGRGIFEAGLYSAADLQDSPEIGCLEQVAAEAWRRHVDGNVPRAIADVLARAKAAGRSMGT
jgi:hypothetical protein